MFFDTLTFEIDDLRHRATIGTAVNFIRIKRPVEEQFSVKVFDDTLLIDSFEVSLPKDKNAVLFDMEIIETNYSHYGSTFYYTSKGTAKLIQEQVSDLITIDNKEYHLMLNLLLPKEFHLKIE